ncbi:unnamed protein product [Paramecium sonneborni]|uniref:Uncharacterized protein n=1 Tax=Paramecium sonneborni TaxID=65129 RepID=A0A8S1KK61_9CILI|nr:unnamed protein product [Paramecium sonneborni]
MSQKEKGQLQQNEQSTQNQDEISQNSYLKFKDFVPPQQEKAKKCKRNYKSKFWNEKNVELLYRLNAAFSGDSDLILKYFQKHVDNKITFNMIKQKFRYEQKNNPEKLFDKSKKPKLKEKLQKKLEAVAKMQSLNLEVKWSQVSEINDSHIEGKNEQDTEIQKNLMNEINSLLKTNRVQQAQLKNQQQQI